MKLSTVVFACLAVFSLFSVVGCGDNNGKPEGVGKADDVQNARDARKIFDEAKGDWNKVSDANKAKLEQMYGKERATAVWQKMANPYAPGPGAVKPQGGTGTPNPMTGQ